ncbi:MAG: hypothetical protein R3B13_20685 [Polyangiaceae bacterium]
MRNPLPTLRRASLLLVTAVACSSCQLLWPVDDYSVGETADGSVDAGGSAGIDGGGGIGAASGGASGSGGAGGSSGASGSEGSGGGCGAMGNSGGVGGGTTGGTCPTMWLGAPCTIWGTVFGGSAQCDCPCCDQIQACWADASCAGYVGCCAAKGTELPVCDKCGQCAGSSTALISAVKDCLVACLQP